MDLIKSFKALSDKTRLRLLYLLQEYELNVNEIVQIVEMIQSGVSRHLKILVESDILTFRRDASFIYYTAAKHDNKNIKRIMGGSWSGFEKEKIKTWLKDAGFTLLSIDSFQVKHKLTINLFISKKT